MQCYGKEIPAELPNLISGWRRICIYCDKAGLRHCFAGNGRVAVKPTGLFHLPCQGCSLRCLFALVLHQPNDAPVRIARTSGGSRLPCPKIVSMSCLSIRFRECRESLLANSRLQLFRETRLPQHTIVRHTPASLIVKGIPMQVLASAYQGSL